MNARRAIREIYRGLGDGFEIAPRDAARVRRSRGNPTYGELTATGVDQLITSLQLTATDSFYDLGAGIGKVVLQVAMTVPVARCVGVELCESRCRVARSALLRARKQRLILARRCVLASGDLIEQPLDDATVVYTCSTAFSLRFMTMIVRRLRSVARPLRFVTLQELARTPRGAEKLRPIAVATTWSRRSWAHVYQLRCA